MIIDLAANGFEITGNAAVALIQNRRAVDRNRLNALKGVFAQYKLAMITVNITRTSDSDEPVHVATSTCALADPAHMISALSSYKVYRKEQNIKRTLKWATMTQRVENTWKLHNQAYDETNTPHIYILTKGIAQTQPLAI